MKEKFNYQFDELFENNNIAKDVYHYICDEDLRNNFYLLKEYQRSDSKIDSDAATLTQQIFKILRPEEYRMFWANMCYLTNKCRNLEEIYWHCFDTKIDGYSDFNMTQFRQIYKLQNKNG